MFKKISKILIFSLFLVLISSFMVGGAITDNIKGYWSMSSNCTGDDSGNGFTGTVRGTPVFVNSTEGCDFEKGPANNAISIDAVTSGDFMKDGGTFCLWSKTESGATNDVLGGFGFISGANPNRRQLILNVNTGTIDSFIWSDGTSTDNRVVGDALSTTTWKHFCMVWDTNGKISNYYVDKVNKGNSNNIIVIDGLLTTFTIGALNFNSATPNTGWYDGKIMGVGLWTDQKNTSEIESLYDEGRTYNPFAINLTDPFQITAKSFWDNNSITNFSVLMNGTVYNTTNGTIITPYLQNNTNLFNITFFDDEWFNNTYLNTAVSSNLEGVLKQTQTNITFNFSTGDLINSSINLTSLDTGEYFNVTNGSKVIYANKGLANFSVISASNIFSSFNMTLNLSALNNVSFSFSVNETQNVITFLDENTSSAIVNATILVYSPKGITLNLTTNSSGQINFSYIQNGSLDFGSYFYYFDKLGYVAINLTDTINISNIPHVKTYNLSRAKLTINVYDRVTRNLLSGVNVTVAFIGLFNETTTTGTVTKDNLTIVGGDYLVYASTDDYKTSVRSLTFTNQEEFTLNFYLLNLSESTAGTVFVTTTDSFFRKITGAKVELLEYIPSSLSYVSVAECVTNIDAQCSFAVELNTKVYYIRGTAIIGSIVLIAETNQNGEIFTVNNANRDLVFYTRTEFSVSSSSNLIYSITETFIANTSSISVDFSTFDGTAETVCIEYFKRDGTVYTSVTGDTYCLQASSALQNIDASVNLNRSNDYEARVYIKKTSNTIPLKTYVYPSKLATGEVFSDDMKSAIIMIFWVFALAFALHSKNITIWFIFAILLSWAEVLIFPLYSIVSISVFKTVLSLFTLMIARKKQDFT